MTLRELYAMIDGDYDRAMNVLRIEKLMDKHIRKFPASEMFSELARAGETMDAEGLFESAHAMKGVCGNLGLVKLAELASEICEEFRPGSERKLTDDEVRGKLDEIAASHQKAMDGVRRYEQELQ